MQELELNIPITKTIPAINPWYGTGLMLRKEHIYLFEVIPAEQTWKDGKMLGKFTAEGKLLPQLFLMYPFIRMPSVKWFALLGCIDKKRSTYFKIGIERDGYIPSSDGELTCFANDALGFYKHNNEGSMTLTITRIG